MDKVRLVNQIALGNALWVKAIGGNIILYQGVLYFFFVDSNKSTAEVVVQQLLTNRHESEVLLNGVKVQFCGDVVKFVINNFAVVEVDYKDLQT